jgi:hypothetical protein
MTKMLQVDARTDRSHVAPPGLPEILERLLGEAARFFQGPRRFPDGSHKGV